MNKYRTKVDYTYAPGIVVPGDSVTYPDMSLDIRTLLLKHTQGLELERRAGSYMDESDLEEPVKTFVDITEVEEARSMHQSRYEDAKRRQDELTRLLKSSKNVEKREDHPVKTPPITKKDERSE